ncbi:Cytochrome P450 [Penicillium griseofulvum]|uniref:Cytochrome P450 n=1 Tax=Penicillium patulum TaxID=5078 RepID=A0A135LTY5_PENPA|nr:Cytochrome P450 [Penicillium griseofulvum]KXG52447.1 Cytochrome P450 [Penicillium griseofulvum]
MLQSILTRLLLEPSNGSASLRDWSGFASVILLLSAFLYKVLYVPASSLGRDHSPPLLKLPSWKVSQFFFEKRFDFIKDGFKATSSAIYQTNLFRHNAIVLSGDEGRQTFFKEKGLCLYDTFSIMMGSSAAHFDPHQVGGVVRRMASIQRPENLQKLIPLILSECRRKMDAWGRERILDPCSSLHEVTFQLVMRIASFDIANDPALSARLKSHVDTVDSITNPYSTWFPWLPGPALFQKFFASVQIYRIVQAGVNARKKSGVRKDDMLQQMLDDGDSMIQIFGCILGLSLAGARATGTIVTWLIMHISSNPTWSSNVQEEIRTFISTHTSSSAPLSGDALVQALSKIPLTAWESQTPNLDLCIRETLRTSQPYTAVRKNTGPDLTIGPYVIPSGSLVVYPFSDTALNPKFYSDPTRWDPSRVVGKEAPFIGWGGGKHACKGQRLATLSMKLLVTYALTQFHVTMVDAEGERMNHVPLPDCNDSATCRPKEECGIKFVEK